MAFRIKPQELEKKPALADPMSLSEAVVRLVGGIGAIVLVVSLLVHWLGPTGYIPGMLASLPALFVIVPGFLGFWPAWYRFASEAALERWQGSYYAFDDQQVRIVEIRDVVWIVLKDALKPSRMAVDERELSELPPGSLVELEEFRQLAIRDTALLELLNRRNYPEVNRFRIWLDREVLTPIYRRRTGQRVPYRMGQRAGEAHPLPMAEPQGPNAVGDAAKAVNAVNEAAKQQRP